MESAGLKDYPVHTTRSAATTNALLVGLPLNIILAKAGWKTPNTFIKHYMKPLAHASIPPPEQTTDATSPMPSFKAQFSEVWNRDYKLKPKTTMTKNKGNSEKVNWLENLN